MPTKKTTKQKNGNGATLDFEAQLWAAADKMRGHMDASEYKHVVLGLAFSTSRMLTRKSANNSCSVLSIRRAIGSLKMKRKDRKPLMNAISMPPRMSSACRPRTA